MFAAILSHPRRFVWLTLAPGLVVAAAASAAVGSEALRIEEGSVARSEVVALGRDLVVAGEAQDTVAAINGAVQVTGTVGGDLIVLGGDATLGRSSRVAGDVFVLGGKLEAQRGAIIDGRSVSYPSVAAAWLILLEGPSLGMAPLSRYIVAVKIALLAAWLGWAILVFATHGRELLTTSESVSEEPFRNFFLGLAGVLALFLTALLLSALSGAVVGIPLLFLAVFVALLLKLWGVVAVFHASGRWLAARLLRRQLSPLNCAAVGLAALGIVKLIPQVGVWAWTVVTLIGVGAAISTKLGRRPSWVEGEPPRLDALAKL